METSAPRAMSDSTRWLPMKLAPPVTATLRPSHSDFSSLAASDESELPLVEPGPDNVFPPGNVSQEGRATMRKREWTPCLPRLHSPYLDSSWKYGYKNLLPNPPDARAVDLSTPRRGIGGLVGRQLRRAMPAEVSRAEDDLERGLDQSGELEDPVRVQAREEPEDLSIPGQSGFGHHEGCKEELRPEET